jgi:hypothetical protein
VPGGRATVVFQTPSASFFMEMAFACHCVKSPASNTLNASGAVNAKVCLLSSLLFFEFVLLVMCFSFLLAFVHYFFARGNGFRRFANVPDLVQSFNPP